jgi:hypothetical protein
LNKYQKQDLGNHKENCGRKPVLDEDKKQSIIELVNFNRWMTAAVLIRDKDLNPDGLRADTI